MRNLLSRIISLRSIKDRPVYRVWFAIWCCIIAGLIFDMHYDKELVQNTTGNNSVNSKMKRRWPVSTISRTTSPPTVPTPPLSTTVPDDSKSISDRCSERFNDTLEDNMAVIENYPIGRAKPYLSKIGADKPAPDKMAPFPVIITAMDKNFYPYSQGMFITFHRILMKRNINHTEVRMIVYDVGLTQRQLKVLHEKCRCELRRFPFEQYPPHVRNLKNYAFKPILIQKSLMEFGFIWWVDISIKFMRGRIGPVLNQTKEDGILFFVSTDDREKASIAKHTDLRTFRFLGEDVCKFRPYGETWAGTEIFYYNDVSRTVAKAWAICALNEDCIAPKGTEYKLTCDDYTTQDGQCHRFDQSVFSILLRRLFHDRNMYPLETRFRKIFYIKRREMVTYFERCLTEITCY